jgi:SAM-dependent methyltransferase
MVNVKDLLVNEVPVDDSGVYVVKAIPDEGNEAHTEQAFSDKWTRFSKSEDNLETLDKFQREWYLKLYGFESEKALAEYLSTKKVILDAGCGLGYKAAWFAEVAPNSLVLAMDLSDSVSIGAKRYAELPNLEFIRADIAEAGLKPRTVDYVSCDQVIHHTDDPHATFDHLSGLLDTGGEFACYVYAKKAVPRELLDDYFRNRSMELSRDELRELSEQVTTLGKTLAALDVKIDVPDIPGLEIKGGTYDLQRFIYWNFLKCFWRDDWSDEMCVSTNFDWYSPSNAFRYSKEEFLEMPGRNELKVSYLHTEEACHSGRFQRA